MLRCNPNAQGRRPRPEPQRGIELDSLAVDPGGHPPVRFDLEGAERPIAERA